MKTKLMPKVAVLLLLLTLNLNVSPLLAQSTALLTRAG